MSLFKRHKKFEEQLNEQLGDMEVKPSSSLWDRIDSEITGDSFESGVQSSLENFEQMPYPETWDKIAAELPEPKLGNGLIKYYIVAALAVLFSTGIYIGQNWQPETQFIAQQESSKQLPDQEAISEQVISNNTSPEIAVKVEEKESRAVKNEGEKAINEDAEVLTFAKVAKPITQPLQTQTSNPAVSKDVEHTTPGQASPALTQTSMPSTQPHIVKQSSDRLIKPEVIDKKSVNYKDANGKDVELVALTPVSQAGNNPPADQDKVVREEPVVPAEPIQTIHQTEVIAVVPSTLNQPRELTETKPDSALYAQKMQAYDEQPKAEEFSPFSISVLAGAHLSYTTYGAPKKSSTLNFERNIELRKELERPDIDWAGGFLVDYRINNKWMLSSGIAMVNFSQKFEYNIEKAQDPNLKNESGAPTTNPSDSFVVGSQYSNRIKFSWTEIPLYVNYTIVQKNKWNIDVQTGVSYAFINTVDGGMIGYDNKGVLVLKGEESFPNIKNTVFATVMPQVSYQFAPSISLGLAPTVKYSLTSIIGNEYWIQQHPYFIGMNICLRKRF